MRTYTGNLLDTIHRHSREYKEHAELLGSLEKDASNHQDEINGIFEQARVRRGLLVNRTEVQHVLEGNTLHCRPADRLIHTLALELCDIDGAEFSPQVREILFRAIAVRLSIRNFSVDKQMVDYLPNVQRIHEECRQLDIDSLLPFLCTGAATMAELKRIIGPGPSPRFTNLLMELGAINIDPRFFHFLGHTLIKMRQEEIVPKIIQDEADRHRVPLRGYIADNPPLADVYVIGLVESGQCDQAIAFAESAQLLLQTRPKMAEKYSEALRILGKFEVAEKFLTHMLRDNMRGDVSLIAELERAKRRMPDFIRSLNPGRRK